MSKYLVHYGVKGMQWGKHLPGVDMSNLKGKSVHTVYGPNGQSRIVAVNKSSNTASSSSGSSSGSSGTIKSKSGTTLMTRDQIKSIIDRNNAAASGKSTESETTSKETTKSKKDSTSTKTSKDKSATKNSKSDKKDKTDTKVNVNSKTTDEEIIYQCFGNEFNEANKNIREAQIKKGSLVLTDDELRAAVGKNYDSIMKKINDAKAQRDAMIKAEQTPTNLSEESIDAKAYATIRGDNGNGGERMQKLGDNYGVVQARVNEILRERKKKEAQTAKKVTPSNNDSTKEVKHMHSEEYLVHNGFKGQRWGVRRY